MGNDAMPWVAALLHNDDERANELLWALVRSRQQLGWRVDGLLRQDRESVGGGKRLMLLQDVSQGSEYLISQDLGRDSDACCVDESGLAAASVVLRRCLQERPDLVVVNRFGKLEVNGGGLADELLALMAAEIPLIVLVSADFEPSWRHFSGSMAAHLPPNGDALVSWCDDLPRVES